MTTQTQITPTIRPASFFALTLTDRPEEPIQASSIDYGFDMDEEELAKESLAPITPETGNQPADFADEICAMHFLS
ncbi:MAG: hypothetical protein AB1649_26645 [Chloroflexota bacterium]